MTVIPFVFQAPTRIEFAIGLAAQVGEILKQRGASRILVVTDHVLVNAGVLAPIFDSFQDDPTIRAVMFSDVPPDSNVESVEKGVALALAEKCDAVLAVGGGSVIDTAKVINIGASYGGKILDYQGLNNLPGNLMPLVAVPTTAGTGSEVSAVAMIKDNEEGKKLLYGSRYLAPDVALLDPNLLLSLPAKLTAATGLDAVTHCIESYAVEMTKSPITDALCLDALSLLFKYLPTATSFGDDIESRSYTLVAATMAGLAFTNSGVGIVHALAHATGGQFGTHHGVTNSVFLPHGMFFNLDVVSHRYANMARHLNFVSSKNDDYAAKKLIEKVRQLANQVGLPGRLRDLGVPNLSVQQTEYLANLALTDPAIMFNPKVPTLQDIVDIYERAY